MSRATKRGGFGSQKGSLNSKIVIQDTEPKQKSINLIWIDTATPAVKVWTGLAWITVATI
jgi:hypothetical protein